MAIEYRTESEFTEWLDGEPHPKVSPRIRHGAIQARLVYLLQQRAPHPHIIATEGAVAVDRDPRSRTKLIPDISHFALDRYFSTGSKLVLDVDFRKRTIVSYTDAGIERFAEDERFCSATFPWFTFGLRELFSVLDPLPEWVE